MRYEMEELVPIVTKLAKKYTSGESTSITYEKAQQLMGAVIYSIHEGEGEEQNSLMEIRKQSPEKAYEIGARRVEQKTKDTLSLYNELMTHFCSYENECLYDTVVKGLPEFFKWYDFKYEPQNIILTLDYPVLKDNPKHTGIDKISDYVLCIRLEQRFLNKLSHEYVMRVLSGYNSEYRFMIDNLCEIVLKNMLLHMLAGKEIENMNFSPDECQKVQTMIQNEDAKALCEKLKGITNVLIEKYYESDTQLAQYLGYAIESISIRIKFAADHGNLAQLF